MLFLGHKRRGRERVKVKVTISVPGDDLLLVSCGRKQRRTLDFSAVAFILLRMRRYILFKWSYSVLVVLV